MAITPPDPEPVTNLARGDFRELGEHLNRAFLRDDFMARLPAWYQPTDESMGRQYVVRSNGRIVASAGRFDLGWRVGGVWLRLAGVGGVAVHPDHAGRGLMRRVVDAVMRDIVGGGYHAAYLDGARLRYRHWGFEKGGCEAELTVTTNSLAHQLDVAPDAAVPTLDPWRSADLPDLRRLYQRQPLTIDHPPEDFACRLNHWRHEMCVLRDTQGTAVAYAGLDRATQTVHELGVDDPSRLDGLVVALHRELGGVVRFRRVVLLEAVFLRLRDLSDALTLREAGGWRVLDMPRVMTALLRLKQEHQFLAPGRLVVRLTDRRQTVRLETTGGAPTCVATDEPAELETTSDALLQALTGPVPTRLRDPAGLLDAWRPLPLGLLMQDRM